MSDDEVPLRLALWRSFLFYEDLFAVRVADVLGRV